MKRAVYAGSFDPLTLGHLWMIAQGAALFDEVIVAVGTNPDKRTLFSAAERVELLRACVGGQPRVVTAEFTGQFLVHFARAQGAAYLLRGIRDGQDYEYERMMRQVNSDLQPEITTVFLMPPRELAEISSSFVRGLLGLEGWPDVVARYVPEPVWRKLVAKFPSNR